MASYQGSICYALQSIHVMHPCLLTGLLGANPSKVLYWNVCYGTSVLIYQRPAMRKLTTPYRAIFSAFGAWMFGYSSLGALNYLSDCSVCRPTSAMGAVVTGYLAGRLMYGLLEAYLYFVDMSHRDEVRHRRNPTIVDFL